MGLLGLMEKALGRLRAVVFFKPISGLDEPYGLLPIGPLMQRGRWAKGQTISFNL